MMKTRKRNTGVVQHAAIIITGPGHQVFSGRQTGGAGAVRDNVGKKTHTQFSSIKQGNPASFTYPKFGAVDMGKEVSLLPIFFFFWQGWALCFVFPQQQAQIRD